jgi:cysteine-rich repeat protein
MIGWLNRRRSAASLLSLALIAATGSAHALPYRLGLTLSDPNPRTSAQFGAAVAAMGSDVLVGSPGDNNSIRHGAAYLFDGTSGALLRTFADPAPPPGIPQPSTEFGGSIAAQGGRVLIGAGGANRAYLFDGTTGALLLTLVPPPPSAGRFGGSVAFAGTNLVVGAPGSGQALLFDGTDGQLLRTFAGSSASDFGASVGAIGADVLASVSMDLLGGPSCFSDLRDDATGTVIHSFAGANVVGVGARVLTGGSCTFDVRLYDGTTGMLLQSFSDPNPAPPLEAYTFFGAALGAVGANVLVSAPIAFGNGEGAVYLFDPATGDLLDTIRNPRPDCCVQQQDAFGISLAAVGENVVVGAVNEGTPPVGPGRAYVFLPSCGDGTVDPGEQCDDANTRDGDCCSGSCRDEGCPAARALDDSRLVLRRNGGKEKLVFISKDRSMLFPAVGSADDPGTGSPGGAVLELRSLAEPSGAVLTVPRGVGKPGWKSKDGTAALHKYTNPAAPLGPSPVKTITLKRGKLIKVVAPETGLTLDGPQGTVVVRLTVGSLRQCALFDAATIRRDESGRFEAKALVAPDVDCSELLP